jgi:TetR/AcrR family fatty acid metabolism transcriptional regulator
MAQEKKEKRRIAIMEAAVKAFSQLGYHACTMNQVAREAGVADGTLYLYFESKEDLLIKAFKHVIGNLMELLDKELVQLDAPADKLKRIIELHFQVMENDPSLAGFMQFQLRQPDPSIRQAIRRPLSSYARRIERVIEEGHKTGDFRASLGARAMRRLIFGGMDETVSAWCFRGEKDSLADKAGPLLDAILHGLAAK